MKQILTPFFILTSLILFIANPANAMTMPEGDFEAMRKTGTARVTEIVNPLTIKLDDGRFIHLAGLDFPDLNYYDPGDLSVTAVEILEDFLKGKTVAIYQTSSTKEGRLNRLGHHIAHLQRTDNNVWVQGLLLSLGVARVRTTGYNPDMAKQMLALEDQARKTKAGLWDIDGYHVLLPEQAQEHIGSYQIIEGTVRSVSMHKNRLYLNFGQNWKEDFTVSMSAFDLKKFIQHKIDPQKWNGKNLRVRGWIKSYNGPYMQIDHPERFEALFETDHTAISEEEREEKPHNSVPKTIKTDGSSALPTFNN